MFRGHEKPRMKGQENYPDIPKMNLDSLAVTYLDISNYSALILWH